MRPRIGCTVLLIGVLGGCAPYRTRVSYANVRVDATRPLRFEHETKLGDAELAFELGGDVLDVRVVRPVACRRVLVRPLLADTYTEKTLTPVGRGTQYGLLGSAVLLGALGAAVASGSCPADDAGECDRDEQQTQRSIGAGLVAAGVVAAGALFVNVVRLQPERNEAVVIDDFRSEEPFVKCRELPVVGERLGLELADGRRLALTTGRDGHAVLDLKSVAPSRALAVRPFAVLSGAGTRPTIVDLGGTTPYRAAAELEYAAEACQRRCDTARADCQTALRRKDVPPESADWICTDSEQSCRDGCTGLRATPEQVEYVLHELAAIAGGLAELRPPLDARQKLAIASLLERAQALRPYTRGMHDLLDAGQRQRAAKLLSSVERSLPRIAPLLKQWAETAEQRALLQSLEVLRLGL